jgi:hypothetical protein
MQLKVGVTAVLVAVLVGAFVPAGASAAPVSDVQAAAVPVNLGTVVCTDAAGLPALCDVTVEVERFVARGGQLYAQVLITVENAAGATDTARLRLPVTAAQGTCEILHLELGPIHLDLLGLVVDVSEITIDITAEQGPGNLLGNLLCAIAGLLDSQASPNALAQLLNRILGLLG